MPLLLQGVLERDGGLLWELVIHIATYDKSDNVFVICTVEECGLLADS